MSDDINDGLLPFADRRFRREQLVEQPVPAELGQFLEREISQRGIELPHQDFLELRCVSSEFAVAVFMVRRNASGELRLLVPRDAVRKPS